MSEGLSEIEKNIVYTIENNLRSKEIDVSRAQAIAAAVLKNLKSEMTEFQLFQAADVLRRSFPEITGAAAEAEKQYEDKIRDIVIDHAGKLLKEGEVSRASELLAMAIDKNQEIRVDG